MACFQDGIAKPMACFQDGIAEPMACFQDGPFSTKLSWYSKRALALFNAKMGIR